MDYCLIDNLDGHIILLHRFCEIVYNLELKLNIKILNASVLSDMNIMMLTVNIKKYSIRSVAQWERNCCLTCACSVSLMKSST
ncbi:hypothetical protein WH47_00345 [Habropoda laboriosa]|uniref:Uncharacterized protein n=1 Tax=Habropoda laboriosa TaxID=597456 RepID=A0A0L7R1W4_9HYME|nr:hypothetical protein WH47_00345 [Habropoda laboriosa]